MLLMSLLPLLKLLPARSLPRGIISISLLTHRNRHQSVHSLLQRVLPLLLRPLHAILLQFFILQNLPR